MTLDLISDKKTEESLSKWNLLPSFIFLGVVAFTLLFSLIRLQLVEGADLTNTAGNNGLQRSYIYPNRGIITDRNGVVLAENIASTKLILNLIELYENNVFNEDRLLDIIKVLDITLGEDWFQRHNRSDMEPEYYVLQTLKKLKEKDGFYARFLTIELIGDLDNDETIKVKSNLNKLEGIELYESNKRRYPYSNSMSHILGYTSIITAEDLNSIDYLGYGGRVALNGFKDVVGRLGVESVYDDVLIGSKGIRAVEIDRFGKRTSDVSRDLQRVTNGKNLQLSIDIEAQEKMYESIVEAVKEYGAEGGVGIIQDVTTGELIVMVSAPGYDNNSFIGGISYAEYKKLLEDETLPLLNRSIGAQLPPGSTFKTLTAIGALSEKAIRKDTIYVSRAGYTFSNGAHFQEYRRNVYGSLNVVGALTVSSNIFFCETIRNWDINKLVPYYESFGIGSRTGIDLVGETAGRLPSPSNKIALAKLPAVTWLDPIWYPEGDGCNTVIGQGITLTTPLQMVNWVSAIANDGILLKPHLGLSFFDSDSEENLVHEPIRVTIATDESLQLVQKGMWSAVNGSNGGIFALKNRKVEISAKTGTAEFGALNEKGIYENRHAWVTGYFPSDEPKYSFVVLLENGKESYNAAKVAGEYIDWFVENIPTE